MNLVKAMGVWMERKVRQRENKSKLQVVGAWQWHGTQ